MSVIETGNVIEGSTGQLKFAGVPTSGAGGTFPGASRGQLLVDTTNGVLYQNQGTYGSPSWVKVGTQS